MLELLNDATFWVLISTIIFAIVAWKKAKGPLVELLDARTERIRKELEEAERLRVEAQEVLADYQRKHRDAMETANEIIENASEKAARMETEMTARMDEDLARREQQLVDRIARAEQAAVKEIRIKAAEIATSTVETILKEQMTTKDSELIEDAIKTIPQKLQKAS